jgi:hypothetical protein
LELWRLYIFGALEVIDFRSLGGYRFLGALEVIDFWSLGGYRF